MFKPPVCRPSAHYRTVYPALAIAVASLLLISCSKQSDFAAVPPPHPIMTEVEWWPVEYYWLVQTGVSSRVMGIRSGSETVEEALAEVKTMLDDVMTDWDAINSEETPTGIVSRLQSEGLDKVATAIDETLSANASAMPTGGSVEQLQALAIKRGLTNAYWEVNRE